MPILEMVLVIIVVGIGLWLVNKYVPMQPTVQSILNAVVIIALVVWILFVCFPGTMHHIENARIGH